MATEVEITTAIETAQTEKGILGLRKGLRDLISLQQDVGRGTAQWDKLQKAINETEGELGELNDSFNTLRGSGVDRLTASGNLLQEGLFNADTGKIKLGLQGIGGAMKAIPIFLLIEGARLLFENFDKVVEIFTGTERKAADLKRELEQLNAVTDTRITLLGREIARMEEQKAPLDAIIAKYKELSDLKTQEARNEIASLAKQIVQTEFELSKIKPSARGGPLAALWDSNKKEELEANLKELRTKLEQAKNTIITSLIDTENKIKTVEENARKDALERSLKYEALLKEIRDKRILGIINDYDREIATEKARYDDSVKAAKGNHALLEAELRIHQNKMADIENKYIDIREKAKDEARKKERERLEQQRAEELYITQLFADQDNKVSEETEKKRRERKRRDLDNELAQQKAFQKLTIDEQTKAINEQRDLELTNTQLTVDQRVAIIEKAEEKIAAIRLASLMRDIETAQQGFQILSNLYQLDKQNQEQRLRELEEAKNVQLTKDQERAQAEIDAEYAKSQSLLQSSGLTAQQKEQIKLSSENKILSIEKGSKNSQLKAEAEFQKQELAVKKDLFEKEKKLKLLNIAIDTASSLVKTTAQLGGVGAATPVGIAMLAGIAALGITQAAVVASQEFDGGGTAAPTGLTVPSLSAPGGGGGSGAPEGRAPREFNPDAITPGRRSGRQEVVVYEGDIKTVQERVKVLEGRAEFTGE